MQGKSRTFWWNRAFSMSAHAVRRYEHVAKRIWQGCSGGRKDLTDGGPRRQSVEPGVDLVEPQWGTEQCIHRQPAILIQGNEARDVALRNGGPHVRAAERFLLPDEGDGLDRELLIRVRQPDADRAAAAPRGGVRGREDRRAADGLECEVDAAAGQLRDPRDDVARPRVDRVLRA